MSEKSNQEKLDEVRDIIDSFGKVSLELLPKILGETRSSLLRHIELRKSGDVDKYLNIHIVSIECAVNELNQSIIKIRQSLERTL